MNRFVYVLLLVVLFAAEVFAQGSEDSSMQEDTSVADLLSLVASDHGVKIYYQRQWVDTLAFKGDLEALSLREALDLLLKGTNIKSYFFDNGDVLLTRVFTLYPDLSDSFFESDDNTGGGIDVVAIEVEKNLILGDSDDNAPKVIEVGKANGRYLRENVKVSGIVSNQETLEPVIGAYVYLESPAISTITDADGRFELLLPVGNQEVFLKSFGMQSTSRKVVIYGPGTLDLSLKEHVTALNEIVIEADRDQNIRGVQTGTATLDIQTIKNLPAVFGEVDVVKSILTLPGVETVGEAATGFNVRGGTVGQNLVLLNGGTVYNPSHLFGFFSAFNGDLVQDVELMKSGIPAKYGGRISSVLEVQTEEGDMSEGSVEGAIGPLTGKILYQGPIVKEKLSILAGVRSSYSNWLLRQVPNASYQNSSADFGDANLVLKYQVDAKNSLTLSGYLSRDKFDLATDTVYTYHNQVLGLSWKHAKSDRLNFDVAYHYSGYGFGLDYDEVPENAFTLQSRINHHELNLRGTFFSQSEHSFEFGVNNIFYRLRPGDVSPGSGGSFVETKKIAAENGLETSIFISDQFDLSNRLSFSVGLRYSMFNYLGSKDVFTYSSEVSKSTSTIVDTTSYGTLAPIETYHGPEWRIGARYTLDRSSSVKFSASRIRQYIHMLSNTIAVSPTDTWKLSDTHLRPQVGDQVSLGFYKNFFNDRVEFQLEGYYRWITDAVDFKNGAVLFLNEQIETDLINGKGRVYGMEMLIRKKYGKLNGWISYTYSRSLIKLDGNFAEERVNGGRWFPSNVDKPHSVSLVSNYKFSKRVNVSLNYTYSTGRPVTLPLASYNLSGAPRIFYSERNEFRIPDYSRVDLSINLEGSHRLKKLAHSSWSFSIYNLLGRDNVYSIYFTSEGSGVQGYQLSVFADPIPTITYNFKF